MVPWDASVPTLPINRQVSVERRFYPTLGISGIIATLIAWGLSWVHLRRQVLSYRYLYMCRRKEHKSPQAPSIGNRLGRRALSPRSLAEGEEQLFC
jgi:hypothetical protein